MPVPLSKQVGMRVSKLRTAFVIGLSVMSLLGTAGTSEAASKKSRAKSKKAAAMKSVSSKKRASKARSAKNNRKVVSPESESVTEFVGPLQLETPKIHFEPAALADIVNSYSTIGQLTADLVRVGLATASERTAIENFLVDRGVSLETRPSKMKFEPSTSTYRWSEISLTVLPDGSLKNSFGQTLTTAGKTLDSNFGEAYLSFDHKTPRARVMDFFLQEAHADVSGATPALRAWGSLTAGLFGALNNANVGSKFETDLLFAKLSEGAALHRIKTSR